MTYATDAFRALRFWYLDAGLSLVSALGRSGTRMVRVAVPGGNSEASVGSRNGFEFFSLTLLRSRKIGIYSANESHRPEPVEDG